jgi:hypothetical protein
MVFIAEPNIIAPATSKAAPVSKGVAEFEPFIDTHMTKPAAIQPMETIISRRWAFRISERGGFNGIRCLLPYPISAAAQVPASFHSGEYERRPT